MDQSPAVGQRTTRAQTQHWLYAEYYLLAKTKILVILFY